MDLFILANPGRDENSFTLVLAFIYNLAILLGIIDGTKVRWGYNIGHKIIKVLVVDRLQIILCYYDSCRCNFHLDRIYFTMFHHVTRYRFLVYREELGNGEYGDVWFPKYMPYAKELHLISKNVKIINDDSEKKHPKEST